MACSVFLLVYTFPLRADVVLVPSVLVCKWFMLNALNEVILFAILKNINLVSIRVYKARIGLIPNFLFKMLIPLLNLGRGSIIPCF